MKLKQAIRAVVGNHRLVGENRMTRPAWESCQQIEMTSHGLLTVKVR